MNLSKYYNELYNDSVPKISQGKFHKDLLIDSLQDRRFGISLIIKLPEYLKTEIELFLEELKQIAPSQYFYPTSDIHITVLPIISCYEGFTLNQISVPEYIFYLNKCIANMKGFNIDFRGITASGSAIMICGFPRDENLNTLRNNLRETFKNSGLQQTIDKRYTLQTAHATVVRFRDELQNKKEFVKILAKYKNHDFGSFQVKELELVFNDWYQRKGPSKLLGKYFL